MIYEILPVNNYIGNNSTVRFDFNFYIENVSQLKVYLFDEFENKIELEYNIDYSINEIKNKNGSYITFPIEGSNYGILKENQKISLELILPISQETQYNNSSLLNLESLEYSFDYLTRLIQILSRKLSLCVKVEESSEITPKALIDSIYASNLASLQNNQNCQAALQEINSLYNQISNYNTTIEETKNNLVSNFNTINDNLDLINLKADKTELDGNFISQNRLLSQANLIGTYITDLSDYLPNDDYNYLVWLQINARNTAGPGANFYLSSDIAPNFYYLMRNVAAEWGFESVIIPVGPERKITHSIDTSQAFNSLSLEAKGYRRMGR